MTGVEEWELEEMEKVSHTDTYVSHPVPAPKRSTLGVVAALDSVVGLCSGMDSSISRTDNICTFRFQFSANTMKTEQEKCGKADNGQRTLNAM